MAELPPDLVRLGDELFSATRRSTARRERRRRFTVATAAAAVAFAALTPAALGPAQREARLNQAAVQLEPPGCDRPRGARFTMAGCESPAVLHRPVAWR
jgi:hypothetical protein